MTVGTTITLGRNFRAPITSCNTKTGKAKVASGFQVLKKGQDLIVTRVFQSAVHVIIPGDTKFTTYIILKHIIA